MRIFRSAAASFVSLALLVNAPPAGAQDTTAAPVLPPVEITGTREGPRSPYEVPFAITRLSPDSVRPAAARASIEELFAAFPGVLAADRANPAQDPRISIRGFGARSAFGVRAIHLRRDGIPLTMPDGQTALDAIDLESVETIEVIRGPASALYGNSAGGVIELSSAPLTAEPFSASARAVASGDWHRLALKTAGGKGPLAHQLSVARRVVSGPRGYATATSSSAYGRAALGGELRRVTLVGALHDQPWADAPGALTLTEFEDDPTTADPAGVRRRAGKAVRQGTLGLIGEAALGRVELSASGYAVSRKVRNPLPFRVVDFDRTATGGALGATRAIHRDGGTHWFSAGLEIQRQDDNRWNYANCADTVIQPAPTANCPVVGQQRGQLLLDQRELVTGTGIFARGDFGLSRRVRGSLGIRHDRVAFELRDRFLTDGRDDTGERRLSALSPSVGINFRVAPLHSLYANAATAFETPTTTELTNQPDGSAGINRELEPQRSLTFETGARGAVKRLRYDVALFTSRVNDELVPFEIPGGGGRRYFRNAGRTRRHGGEAAANVRLFSPVGPVDLGLVYTHSAFSYVDYAITAPGGEATVFSGSRVPGVPVSQLRTRVTVWRDRWFLGADAASVGSVFADDANSVDVPGYAVLNLRGGALRLFGRSWLSPALELLNVLDRRYVPSVVVNAQGGRFYEPAPGRRLTVSLAVGSADRARDE
jgi:iron complex outermembrane recepter protein